MAGTVKEMSLIKQVLQLKQLGESNRGIARKLPINKERCERWRKRSIPTHSEWLYPLTFDAGKGLKEA